jgi:hypothetical protein
LLPPPAMRTLPSRCVRQGGRMARISVRWGVAMLLGVAGCAPPVTSVGSAPQDEFATSTPPDDAASSPVPEAACSTDLSGETPAEGHHRFLARVDHLRDHPGWVRCPPAGACSTSGASSLSRL